MSTSPTSSKSRQPVPFDPPASKADLDLAPKPIATVHSVHRYLRRITIEGIDTYLRATSKFEKRFWFFVILIGSAGTLIYANKTFSEYLKYTTVLDIGYQTSLDLKLPNTWICLWALNYTYFYDRFSQVKSQLRDNKRLQLFAKRLTTIWKKEYKYGADFTVDTVLDIAVHYITMTPIADDRISYLKYAQPQLLNEVLYRGIEMLGSKWSGIRSFYEEGFFDCPSVLKKCSVNGIPIDCCRDSIMGYTNEDRKCYKVDIHNELLYNPNLIRQSQPIELSIETFIDSKYFPSYVVEAPMISLSFQVHQPSMFDDLHNLAAGSSSRLNVRGIRKLKLFDCIDRYRYEAKLHVGTYPLIQQFFKDMQRSEIYTMEHCANGRLVEAMFIRCGCVPYFDTLRPNDSVICTPAHIYACYYSQVQDTPEMEAIEKEAGSQQQKDIFADLKSLVDSECVPLCDRWSYFADVFSTIMDGEEGNISTYWRNKVNVTFNPEYRVETEMLKTDFRTFLASIGDGLGLILGMSLITLVQLAFWLVASLCFLRRLRRVGPSVEDVAEEVRLDEIPQTAMERSDAIRASRKVDIPIIRIEDYEV